MLYNVDFSCNAYFINNELFRIFIARSCMIVLQYLNYVTLSLIMYHLQPSCLGTL